MSWDAWRTEVFGDGYTVWHEGADTNASTARWRQDPAGTSAALLLGLAADDDVAAQAVEAFARSGGVPGPEVTAAVVAATRPERPAGMRVAAALAAYVVTGDPAFVAVIVEVLGHRGVLRGRRGFGADPRLDAARSLALVPPTTAEVDILADAVGHDPEYLVRFHAARSLLAHAGAERELTPPMIEALSTRGTGSARRALARDLRARVRTVD